MNILIVGNGFDIIHEMRVLFSDFVQSPEFKNGIGSYGKHFNEKEYHDFSSDTELWSRFEDFCLSICNKNSLRKSYFMKKMSLLFSRYWQRKEKEILEKQIPKKVAISKFLLVKKINTIISFNYTMTPEIYDFKALNFNKATPRSEIQNLEKWKGRYLKIHDYISKNTRTIIGHDSDEKTKKGKLIMNWGDKTIFNPKEAVFEKIQSLRNLHIYSIGFSFGDSDQDVTNFINANIKNGNYVEIYCYTRGDCQNVTKKLSNSKNLQIILKDFAK